MGKLKINNKLLNKTASDSLNGISVVGNLKINGNLFIEKIEDREDLVINNMIKIKSNKATINNITDKGILFTSPSNTILRCSDDIKDLLKTQTPTRKLTLKRNRFYLIHIIDNNDNYGGKCLIYTKWEPKISNPNYLSQENYFIGDIGGITLPSDDSDPYNISFRYVIDDDYQPVDSNEAVVQFHSNDSFSNSLYGNCKCIAQELPIQITLNFEETVIENTQPNFQSSIDCSNGTLSIEDYESEKCFVEHKFSLDVKEAIQGQVVLEPLLVSEQTKVSYDSSYNFLPEYGSIYIVEFDGQLGNYPKHYIGLFSFIGTATPPLKRRMNTLSCHNSSGSAYGGDLGYTYHPGGTIELEFGDWKNIKNVSIYQLPFKIKIDLIYS